MLVFWWGVWGNVPFAEGAEASTTVFSGFEYLQLAMIYSGTKKVCLLMTVEFLRSESV